MLEANTDGGAVKLLLSRGVGGFRDGLASISLLWVSMVGLMSIS